MHRLAWGLLALAAAACVAGGIVSDRTYRIGLVGGGFALLVVGLWVAGSNGRRIERRWRTHGIRGELELTGVSPQTSNRLAVEGILRLAGRPQRRARFTAYVQTFEHRYVVKGARVRCAALSEDPGRIRVYLRPEQPEKSAVFVEAG